MRRLRKSRAWIAAAAVGAAAVLLFPALAPAAPKAIGTSCASGACKWKPRSRTIRVGHRVVWRAAAGGPEHNVTAIVRNGSKSWTKNTDIQPGASTTHRFRRTGTFWFRCKYHPATMKGFIKVVR